MKKSKRNKNFDLDYLKTLGDNSFLLQLIDLFINSSVEDLYLFDDYIKNNNWDQLGDLAHKLRSRTQHFKMDELSSSLKKIELQCERQSIDDTSILLVQQTKSSYLKIIKELKEESLTLTKPNK